MMYSVPTIKMTDYTKDSIFEKNLLMLLPFYIMRYEKKGHDFNNNPELFQTLLNEYEEIRVNLEKELTETGKSELYTDLTKLIVKIADYIFREEDEVRKGLGDIMGGKVLELESERLKAEEQAVECASERAKVYSVPATSSIPSSTLMSSIEYELFTKWQREFILKKCLQTIKDSGVYDYILIDAPPTLGGWVMNILCASDKVIIPVEASPWGMFGLANMFEFLGEVKQIAPDLEVAGIAVTKVDTRKNYFKQTMETLHQLDNIHVFDNLIRVDSTIEWSQDNSIPVVEYKKSSRSAKEYTELAREVMDYVSR